MAFSELYDKTRAALPFLTEAELDSLLTYVQDAKRTAHRRNQEAASALAKPGDKVIIGDISPKIFTGLTGTVVKRFQYKGKERIRVQLDLPRATLDAWRLSRYVAGGTENCLDIPGGCIGQVLT